MSVILGIFDSSESPAIAETVERLARVTARYGPDEMKTNAGRSIVMAYQAFRTQERLHPGEQPFGDPRGNMVTFDGRLDNYDEISEILELKPSRISDAQLVLTSFEKWGPECFSHFIGEWATAIWSAGDRALYLARDHAGSRTLYYSNNAGQLLWSTYLETFCAGSETLKISKDYLAHFVACQPAGDLTPCHDVYAVPPAHYIVRQAGGVSIRPHWNRWAESQIQYRTDTEYDEHFLSLFGQSIRRRTQPGARILAELSGGMDSSSIVCMADHIGVQAGNGQERLETISCFDDTEPDWDDRPYFEAVETYRGKRGIHIDVSGSTPCYEPMLLGDRVYPYVCGDRSHLEAAAHYQESTEGGGYRVILSGIGGDELMGGVPTGIPELADHLLHGKLLSFCCSSFRWSIAGRRSLVRLVRDAIRTTINLCQEPRIHASSIPPWLTRHYRESLVSSRNVWTDYTERRLMRPSAVANHRTWRGMLETLPNSAPGLVSCCEHRFPFLDRDLVEFLHRVPRAQLVQPGRRRHLMRRALQGIVPVEVLERKRKAFVSHGSHVRLCNGTEQIKLLFDHPLVATHGIVDRDVFLLALQRTFCGSPEWVGHVLRTIEAELWLRALQLRKAVPRFVRAPAHTCTDILPPISGQPGSA